MHDTILKPKFLGTGYKYSKFISWLQAKDPFTRAIFVANFLILMHAIEWLSHKSIDLYSFPQMV